MRMRSSSFERIRCIVANTLCTKWGLSTKVEEGLTANLPSCGVRDQSGFSSGQLAGFGLGQRSDEWNRYWDSQRMDGNRL